MKAKMTVYKKGGPIVPDPKKGNATITPDPKKKPMTADEKFNAAAFEREIENLNEMRRELVASDPDAVRAFDRELKAKGLVVVNNQVKKLAGGGKINVAGYANGGKLKSYLKKMMKK